MENKKIIGILVLGIMLLSFIPAGSAIIWNNDAKEIFISVTHPWKAIMERSKQNCDACNDLEWGCTEYQCRSLGARCEVIAKGTDEETCIHKNRNEQEFPIITALESALKGTSYVYRKTGSFFPREYGVIIYNEDDLEGKGCLPTFKPVTLAINTSEPAECRITANYAIPFDEMNYIMEPSNHYKNHTIFLSSTNYPTPEALEGAGFELEEDNDYGYFIKCQDFNGVTTPADFMMEFCIQDGPDIRAPIIESMTAPLNGKVSFNVSTYPLEVITDEPADCRWAFEDMDYEQMGIHGTNMTQCSQDLGDELNLEQYGCKTTLTEIKVGEETDYFIRCKDKPHLGNYTFLDEFWEENNYWPQGERYASTSSNITTLMSTEQLLMNSITVNEKENDSRLVGTGEEMIVYLEVQTSAGANNGASTCKYGEGSYPSISFYDEGDPDTFKLNHLQRLDLIEGEYTYFVRCRDEANNIATGEIYFQVDLDEEEPIITRVYEEDGNLKIKTNEDAFCKYSLDSCNFIFSEGAEMVTSDGFSHFTSWNTEFDLFIKCEDLFGNKPTEGCTIEVRAFEEETI